MAQVAQEKVTIGQPGLLVLGKAARPQLPSHVDPDGVAQISSGYDHSAVVYLSGRVRTFGGNDWGQLGLGTTGVSMEEPTLVAALGGHVITQAECGDHHTLFLSSQGQLYACGRNEKGQLGIGHENDCSAPTLVVGTPTFKTVAAAGWQSAALTDSGEVWVTGWNEFGQLGLGHRSDQTSFTRVSLAGGPVCDVACGARHTAVLSETGALLVTGWNTSGSTPRFNPVPLRSPVAAVSCGSFHTVALLADGTVWSWGANHSGELGMVDKVNRSSPRQLTGVDGHTVVSATAGFRHTALLTMDGNVLLCGRGEDGELGCEKTDLVSATLVTKSPELVVKQVSFQCCSSLIVVDSKPAEISSLEKASMSVLECPVCCKIMYTPIHQCSTGHSICDTCWSRVNATGCPTCRQPFAGGRSFALESLSAEVQLPCEDCLLRMATCQLEDHREVCPRRVYKCPLLAPCGWRGNPSAMSGHASSQHSDQTWRDLPHRFTHKTSDESLHSSLLFTHGQVFALYYQYQKAPGLFKAAAKYLGPKDKGLEFKFEFEISEEHDETRFRRKLCLDTASVDEMFRSPQCVILDEGQLDLYVRGDQFACQVNVLRHGLAQCLKTPPCVETLHNSFSKLSSN